MNGYLMKLEKQEQSKAKVSKRKKITKIRSKINYIYIRITIEKINETKSWFFEMMNKIGEPLARLTKKNERIIK